jgi:hypothetical protein
MKFRTESGALYIFVDGQLTRFAEHPVIERADGSDIPADKTWDVPATLVYPELFRVGSRVLFDTIHGPIRTTPVKEILDA